MNKIAVLTSGGDAPGMNAAIRGVTRCAIGRGVAVVGVRRGFAGLMDADLVPLTARSVGGILERAGTCLESARAPRFLDPIAREAAVRALGAAQVDGLVVIGGNGSQTGANAVHLLGLPVVGIASTIDNDLFGVDQTLGFDSALNVVVEAADRLRATSSSHRRGALLEVMGRDTGHLAIAAGLASGAEAIVIPEVPVTPEDVANAVRAAYQRGKSHAMVVVSEGVPGGAAGLAQHFATADKDLGFALRVTTLGHVQRGRTPTAFDRNLGSRLAAAATQELLAGRGGVVAGLKDGRVTLLPLGEVAGRRRPIERDLWELAAVLAQ